MRPVPALTHLINRLIPVVLFGALVAAATSPVPYVSASPLAALSPSLGAAASFSVLGATTVTNTGATHMSGDLGIYAGSGAPPHYTGLSATNVGPPGVIHDADTSAQNAQAANTAAFGALIAVPNTTCNVTYPGVKELNGLVLVPGVYCADAFNLAGTLTLDDTGAPGGVWIFRSDLSTLVTTSGVGAKVQFLHGVGLPCNVWWRVASSATIGTGTAFVGNILALTSISMKTGASLNGRALAQTGAVTLDTNIISGPTCAAAATATPTVTATRTATTTPTGTRVGPSPVPSATPTLTQAPPPQNTAVPAPTQTLVPAPTETATATAPAVVGPPKTGGGPLPGSEFPWSQALALGGLAALAVGLGIGAYRRRTDRPTR